ncbi:hypothetical protein Aduo_019174 [Ancylostoma duodenale]
MQLHRIRRNEVAFFQLNLEQDTEGVDKFEGGDKGEEAEEAGRESAVEEEEKTNEAMACSSALSDEGADRADEQAIAEKP